MHDHIVVTEEMQSASRDELAGTWLANGHGAVDLWLAKGTSTT